MKRYAFIIWAAVLGELLVGCSGNSNAEREQNNDIDMSSAMLDLNSTSNWDVTNFQSDDGVQLDIPEAAVWSMTLSPRDEDFSSLMIFRVYCDAIFVEFTLVDQVMRRTSAVGGTGGGNCMPWEIEDIMTAIAVQRAGTAILNAINRGEGVYGVTQENADLFMLSIPEAGVVTFERDTSIEE